MLREGVQSWAIRKNRSSLRIHHDHFTHSRSGLRFKLFALEEPRRAEAALQGQELCDRADISAEAPGLSSGRRGWTHRPWA